jgi:hypothetical protein
VPLFFPALVKITESDLETTPPARLVRAHAAAFGLAVRKPPVAIRPFPIVAVRHWRNAKNGVVHGWLIGQVREVGG